jgi:hypothetical protein
MREKPNVDASPWRERRNARTPRPHNIRGTGGPQGSPRSEADQGVVPGPGALRGGTGRRSDIRRPNVR